MRRITIVLLSVLVLGAPLHAGGETLYGLTAGNSLITFDSAAPGAASGVAAISGLGAGESLVGIDFRPANGRLYGVGTSNRLYTIDPATAMATPGPLLSLPISGASFGIDFNPQADRLRLVSDAELNFRINVDMGAVLADAPLNPGNPTVVAAAYTNNVPAAASTVLFDIDTVADALFRQAPPNDGTLSFVGALGVNTSDAAFDISGVTGTAYAAFTLPGGLSSQLYTIDPGTMMLMGTGLLALGVAIRRRVRRR